MRRPSHGHDLYPYSQVIDRPAENRGASQTASLAHSTAPLTAVSCEKTTSEVGDISAAAAVSARRSGRFGASSFTERRPVLEKI